MFILSFSRKLCLKGLCVCVCVCVCVFKNYKSTEPLELNKHVIITGNINFKKINK